MHVGFLIIIIIIIIIICKQVNSVLRKYNKYKIDRE